MQIVQRRRHLDKLLVPQAVIEVHVFDLVYHALVATLHLHLLTHVLLKLIQPCRQVAPHPFSAFLSRKLLLFLRGELVLFIN